MSFVNLLLSAAVFFADRVFTNKFDSCRTATMKDIAETVLTANAFVELYNFLVSNQCTQASQLVPFVVKLAGAVKKGDLTATAKAELLSRYCRSAVFKTGHYEVDHPLRIRTRPERADFNVYFAEVAGWFFGKRISLIPIRWKTSRSSGFKFIFI